MQVLLPSEIRLWLKFAAGPSVRQFAARVDMSPQYIYAVLRGEKEPSPLLLERAGLEMVYRVKKPSRQTRRALASPARLNGAGAATPSLAARKRKSGAASGAVISR